MIGLEQLDIHIPERWLDSAAWSSYAARMYARAENFYKEVIAQFGMEGIYILAAFTLLLILIIVLHIKSVTESFSDAPENTSTKVPENEDNIANEEKSEDLAGSIDDKIDVEVAKEDEALQRERELSKYLVMQSAVTADILNVREDYENMRQRMRGNSANPAEKNDEAESIKNTDIASTDKIDLSEFITMVLNLLGRKVSETKIVQALYFYYHNVLDNQDIIQTVRAVRDFITFCNTGYFDDLPQRANLPQPKEALTAWANGNTIPCFLLLQAFLNHKIAQADTENGVMQEISYAQAASCAVVIGNIARLSDENLARDSFELAVELAPKSVTAWSNLADSYMRHNLREKALIAYQNVLEIADPIIYNLQRANAQQRLADYYSESGLKEKAQQYAEESDDFYNQYGLTQNLTFSEDAVFKSIWQNKTGYLPEAINSLLMAESSRI